MTFNPSAIDQIDQNTVENDGPQYPVIQWNYGDMKLKAAGGMSWQGGFFIAEDNAPTDLSQHGWTKTSWIHDGGDETEGFWMRDLELSVIHSRKRWEVSDGGRRSNFAWNDYDRAKEVGNPASRTHFLVIIKGMEDLGPFVVTLKGSAGMHFEGTRTVSGALTHFARTVIAAANKMTKKGKWPYRAFWLKVGAARDNAGAPVFTKVGSGDKTSNVVIPVALGLPDKAEGVDLNKHYVGDATLTLVNGLWTDNETWANAWETIIPGSTDDNNSAAKEEAAPEITPEAAVAVGL
jgi:hypothetical protein